MTRVIVDVSYNDSTGKIVAAGTPEDVVKEKRGPAQKSNRAKVGGCALPPNPCTLSRSSFPQ
jgi:hypothetical protein